MLPAASKSLPALKTRWSSIRSLITWIKRLRCLSRLYCHNPERRHKQVCSTDCQYPLFYLKIVAITLATRSRIVHHIETPGLFTQNCSPRAESTDISLLNELFQELFWPASAFLVLLDFGKKVVYAAYKQNFKDLYILMMFILLIPLFINRCEIS